MILIGNIYFGEDFLIIQLRLKVCWTSSGWKILCYSSSTL